MFNTPIDPSGAFLELSSGALTTPTADSFDSNTVLVNSRNNSNFRAQSIYHEIYGLSDYLNITYDGNSNQYIYKYDDWLSLTSGDFYYNSNSFQFDGSRQVIDEITGQILVNNNSEFGIDTQIPLSFVTNDDDTTQTNYFATTTQTYELSGQTLSTSQFLTAQSNTFSRVYGYGLVNAAAAVAGAIGKSPFANISNVGGYNWGLDAIQAPEVWAKGYTGKNVVVAVIDSGVDYTHQDLNDNIWINRGEIFGNGIDDDRNGYVDDIIGWDFVNNSNNPMDNNSHGTHVAGIIAAEGNDFGTTGVAYNSQIMPIKVLDNEGQGASKNIAQGIIYAANNGADVINLSLGGSYSFDNIKLAIQYATQKGAIVVMSAGNDGTDQPTYPAALATDWGIAVGAIDRYGYVASFSNSAGSDSRIGYVVAPGNDIYSTIPNNNYVFKNGTSMAAPYVSGVVALMLSANPNLTPNQVRQIIAQSSLA